MTQATQKSTIAIIDDDLRPFKYSDLEEPLRRHLGDPMSPVLRAVWEFARTKELVDGDDATEEPDISIAGSDQFADALLKHSDLEVELAEIHAEHLFPTLYNKQVDRSWMECVTRCFPDDSFNLMYMDARPKPDDIAHCDGIVLDVFMGDAEPVDLVITLLKDISEWFRDNQPESPPPAIILVSRTSSVLENHRQEFRAKGNVSASALRLVDKAELTSDELAINKLKLLWQQMMDERSFAHRLSGFSIALSNSMKSATEKLSRSLWNLDGDSLLRIYETSNHEEDVFRDHLVDLIHQELIWYLHAEAELRSALESVEQGLVERYKTNSSPHPKRFYASVEDDSKALSKLIEHYYWFPFSTPVQVNTLDDDDLQNNLSQFLPAGSMLAKTPMKMGSEVLIHVTPACDLLRFAERYKTDSIHFAHGKVIEYTPGSIEISLDKIVIPIPSEILGRRANVEVDFKKHVALPAKNCIKRLRKKKQSIIGCLRPRVSQSIRNFQLSRLGRPAGPRMSSATIKYLNIKFQFNSNEYVLNENDAPIRFQATIQPDLKDSRNDIISLRGDSPQQVAAMCAAHATKESIDLSDILNALSLALRDGLSLRNKGNYDFPTNGNSNLAIVSLLKSSTEEQNKAMKSKPNGGKMKLILLPELEDEPGEKDRLA